MRTIDIPGIDFYGPGDFLEDLTQINVKLNELYNTLIVDAPNLSSGKLADYFYGEALGLAEQISIVVAIVAAAFVVIPSRTNVNRLGTSLLVAIGIAVFGPTWFALWDQLWDIGSELTRAISGLFTTQSVDPTATFNVDNWIASVSAHLLAAIPAFFLLEMIFAYGTVILTTTKFFGIIAIGFYAFKSARPFLRLWLSLGLVATVVGRPVAAWFIELGYFAQEKSVFGDTLMGTIAFIGGAYWLAYAMQFVLIFVLYKAVGKIEGWVVATGVITGTVRTITKNKQKVDVARVQKNQAATVRVKQGVKSTVKTFGSETKNVGIRMAAAKVTQVVSKSHPATAAAAVGVTAANRVRKRGR